MAFTGYSYAPGLAILSGAVDSINKRADADADSEKWGKIADNFIGSQTAAPVAPSAPGSTTMGALNGDGPAVPAMAGGRTAMQMPADPEIESRFISTLKSGGLTNPNGLAAVAAYANAESGYSPNNISRTWADPSQSGQPGTSGGILSWRGSRLAAMQQMTAGAPDPVAAQAKFMLTENPDLTVALQNAKSPDEAHALMANAWKFAGYDQPGGENARRLGLTQAYLGRVGDPAGTATAAATPAATPGNVQIASADPSFAPATLAAPVANADAMQALFAKNVTAGAAVNPSSLAIAYAAPALVRANPGAFYNPDRTPKTAGEVSASLQGGGAQPASAPAAAAPAAGGPADAVSASTAPADTPVKVPGYDGTWTRASIAAAAAKDPGRDGIPEDVEFASASGGAGAPAAAAPAQVASAAPAGAPAQAAPQTRAQNAVAVSQSTGLPAQIAPGAPLPPAARPVTTPQTLAIIGQMVRDPATRGAGLQAMMALQTKAAAPPFQFQGGFYQYGSDGLIHQVIAPKDQFTQETAPDGTIWSVNQTTGQKTVAQSNKDATQIVENKDGTRSIVDKSTNTAKLVAGLPGNNVRIWGTDGVPTPPGYPAGTPGFYDASGAPHVGLTSGTDMAASAKGNQNLDGKIFDKIDGSYDKSQGAIGTLAAISRQKQAIDQGMTTGWGSDWQTQAKAAAAKILGLPDPTLDASYDFDAASTQKSAELAKTISQAGHTTNMDLQLGKTIAGGDRSKTEAALRSIVDAQETLARDQIARHNGLVDKTIKLNPDWQSRLNIFKVDTPDVYRYGQGTPNPVADPGSRAAPAQAVAPVPTPAPAPAAAPPAPVKFGSVPIPTAAVGDLRKMPDSPQTRAQFDAIFGDGASQRILGPQR